jgi:hypothetical protein
MVTAAVQSFLWCQWARAPLFAALTLSLSFVAVAFTDCVLSAGAARAVQCIFALIVTLGCQTRQASTLCRRGWLLPLVRGLVWSVLALAGWQLLRGCESSAAMDQSCIASSHDTSVAVGSVILMLLAAVDGVALGCGAEVDVAAGGLGVAASLLDSVVAPEHTDRARAVWDGLVQVSFVIIAGLAWAGYFLQKASLETAGNVWSIEYRSQHGKDDTPAGAFERKPDLGLTLTASPLLVLAACAIVSAVASIIFAMRMKRAFLMQVHEAEISLQTSLQRQIIRSGEAADPFVLPGRRMSAVPSLDENASPSYRTDLGTSAPRVMNVHDDHEYRDNDSRLFEAVEHIGVRAPNTDSRITPPTNAARSPVASPAVARFPSINDREPVEPHSKEQQDAMVPLGASSRRLEQARGEGSSDDDDHDDYASSTESRRKRGPRCCNLRWPGRIVGRLRAGAAQLRQHKLVALEMFLCAAEIGVESALLSIVIPVCCFTLPFLGGYRPLKPEEGTVEWHQGLAPGFVWTAGMIAIARIVGFLGDRAGHVLLRWYLQDRPEGSSTDRLAAGSLGVMEKPYLLRVVGVAVAFLFTAMLGLADLLYRDGDVGSWEAAGIFAIGLAAFAFLLGLTRATTVTLQRESCTQLQKPSKAFAAVVSMVYLCDALFALLAAAALDEGPHSITVLHMRQRYVATTAAPHSSAVANVTPATEAYYYERLWLVLGFVMAFAAMDLVCHVIIIWKRLDRDRGLLDTTLYDDVFAISRNTSQLSESSTAVGAAATRVGSPYEPPSRLVAHNAATFGTPPHQQHYSPRRQQQQPSAQQQQQPGSAMHSARSPKTGVTASPPSMRQLHSPLPSGRLQVGSMDPHRLSPQGTDLFAPQSKTNAHFFDE